LEGVDGGKPVPQAVSWPATLCSLTKHGPDFDCQLSWWRQMTDSLAATKRLRLVAIGLMIAAVNCFSVLDASAKYLSPRQVAERVELKSNLLRVDQEEDRAQLAAAHSLDEEAIS